MTEQLEPTGPVIEDKRGEEAAPVLQLDGDVDKATAQFDALNAKDGLAPATLDDIRDLLRQQNFLLGRIWLAVGGPQASSVVESNHQAHELAQKFVEEQQSRVAVPAFGQPGYKDPGRRKGS